MKTATAALPQNINTITHEQRNLHYRMIAWLYFPVQYMVVRCLVMGVELSPQLDTLYHGLNIPGIIAVVTDFLSNITGVFNVEHFAFIIFNILPYALRLAYNLIPLAAFVYAFYTLTVFFAAQLSIMLHNKRLNINTYVYERTGPPGSGKSSAAGYDIVKLAEKAWAELQYKFLTMRNKVEDYKAAGDLQAILEWYEVRDAYEYNITNDCIPCLWANIPIRIRGQYCSRLTYEHVEQVKRIPYGSCLYFDEIGSVLRIDDWRERPLSVADFARCVRHFGEWHIMSTEQDATNIYKDWRRVTGDIKLMQEQKWVNKPWLFLLPFHIIKKIIIKTEKCNKKMAYFMEKYATLIANIGQRRYKYAQKQSTEPSMQVKSRKRERSHIFYLPTILNYQYSDRTFKNLYLAKDKPIEVDIFKELDLPDTAENRARYLKSKGDIKKKDKYKEDEAA